MKTEKINIAVMGASGKMGLEVLKVMLGSKTFVPFLGIGKSSEVSESYSFYSEFIENIETEILQDIDVWIDFSSTSGLAELANKIDKLKTPVVSGVTGFSENDFKSICKKLSNKAFFWSSNLSPGLWAFRQALKSLKTISHFDFNIQEIHHQMKKDKPSGTAKTIHEDMQIHLNKKIDSPYSIRAGGVFGIHKVQAISQNEIITFEHQALNRSVFAEGALQAASWIKGKKPGIYSMNELYSK
jgi:4-hydroxy-tetrahydrodipicolinate reductase